VVENDEDRRQLNNRIQSYEEMQREITKTYVTWRKKARKKWKNR